jgi:hypothetical protein
MLPEVRVARIIAAIGLHQARKLSCVEAAELLGMSERHFRRLRVGVLFYNMLCHGMDYADPGASAYEARHRQRVLSNLRRRAKSLGYVLQKADPASAVMSVSVS